VRFTASRTSLRLLLASWDSGDVDKSAGAGPLAPQTQTSVCCTLYALRDQHAPSGPKGPGKNRPPAVRNTRQISDPPRREMDPNTMRRGERAKQRLVPLASLPSVGSGPGGL
jgi:hypothetical protein